ncbi:MAG: hypothetical protein AAGJ31_08015, partial [Verrucomicrobiota bacterium]
SKKEEIMGNISFVCGGPTTDLTSHPVFKRYQLLDQGLAYADLPRKYRYAVATIENYHFISGEFGYEDQEGEELARILSLNGKGIFACGSNTSDAYRYLYFESGKILVDRSESFDDRDDHPDREDDADDLIYGETYLCEDYFWEQAEFILGRSVDDFYEVKSSVFL